MLPQVQLGHVTQTHRPIFVTQPDDALAGNGQRSDVGDELTHILGTLAIRYPSLLKKARVPRTERRPP